MKRSSERLVQTKSVEVRCFQPDFSALQKTFCDCILSPVRRRSVERNFRRKHCSMKISVFCGDITTLSVDAIVNAANCTLLGGGGVDGAIHRAAGPELLRACIPLNGCRTGEAKITPGFRLPAKFVVHTPGPIWRGGERGEAELLASCYRNSLRLAEENACRSIAFPCISTGVYRFPKQAAARIAVDSVRSWNGSLPELAIFCCFSESDANLYRSLIE